MFRLKDAVRISNPSANGVSNNFYVALEDIHSWSGTYSYQTVDESNAPETWRVVKKNSINFCKLRPYLAKAFIAQTDCIATSELISFFPKKQHHPKFILYYVLSKHFIENVNQSCYGSKMPRIQWNILGNQTISFPNFQQQQKIVNYLDQNTSKIDTEIALLEQKIEQLEEYKQALIYETVTKGLDKTTPMKDSGIQWIGLIPEHWALKRVKHFYKLGMGETILKEDLIDNGKYPIYSATAEDKYFGYLNDLKNILKIGDLVVGARGTIGAPKLVTKKMGCTQTTIYLKSKRKILTSYTYYYFVGLSSNIFFYDKTAVPQLTVQQLNSQLILKPSKKEQQQISQYLDAQCSQIDQQKELIQKKLDLLKEYKQALIYEVVTGKKELN